MSGAWWLEAACKGRPTAWWFPGTGDPFTGQVARTICARCPVRRQCLAAALDEELDAMTPVGIRGGRTGEQRLALLKRRRVAGQRPQSSTKNVPDVGPEALAVAAG